MAGIRTCDRESQVQRPNHYTTEPPSLEVVTIARPLGDLTVSIIWIFQIADLTLSMLSYK